MRIFWCFKTIIDTRKEIMLSNKGSKIIYCKRWHLIDAQKRRWLCPNIIIKNTTFIKNFKHRSGFSTSFDVDKTAKEEWINLLRRWRRRLGSLKKRWLSVDIYIFYFQTDLITQKALHMYWKNTNQVWTMSQTRVNRYVTFSSIENKKRIAVTGMDGYDRWHRRTQPSLRPGTISGHGQPGPTGPARPEISGLGPARACWWAEPWPKI
jgi:hypothetical protein